MADTKLKTCLLLYDNDNRNILRENKTTNIYYFEYFVLLAPYIYAFLFIRYFYSDGNYNAIWAIRP